MKEIKTVDGYGFLNVIHDLCDDSDGAFVEIKDRNSGEWRDDLFLSANRGWCGYIIDLWHSSEYGLEDSYYCKNKLHVLKVYRTIAEKMDFDFAVKYLDILNDEADLKHFRKIYDTRVGRDRFGKIIPGRCIAVERDEYYDRNIEPLEEKLQTKKETQL